jgi:hypothetical protein
MRGSSVNDRRTNMFDYSERIEEFRKEKVRLSTPFLDKLIAHRNANRDRLISRLSDHIAGITVTDSNFKPQGSVAIDTVVQTRFEDEEYDVDDGLVLSRDDLVDENGTALTAEAVRERVCAALRDSRFVKQPEVHHNCVRVFYSESDEEKHHVDFAIYRRFFQGDTKIRELAGADGWAPSDPTQVNRWFEGLVEERNQEASGRGTQMRRLVQLLKRFCRSRRDWDLPNGMKLTMLIAEYQPPYQERIDEAFRKLLVNLDLRLSVSKVIRNLAHPNKPALTRSENDANVVSLHNRIGEALQRLEQLDRPAANNADSARSVWDWIFQSDGFFADFDAEQAELNEKRSELLNKASLIGAGAKTSPTGIIGSAGVENLPHRFHGPPNLDPARPRR